MYQNPAAQLNIVRAFVSSLYSGRPNQILTDEMPPSTHNQCITQNKAMQFCGVMLRGGRQLIPTAYSFANTDLWAMNGWHLQGSNDLKTWVILDQRQFEEDTHGVQCWGIRDDVHKVYPRGFSAFRVQQTLENSRDRSNMSISQFELFGVPVELPNWAF
jgi:hypothetical protein